jgi:hypothetical protein
MERYRGQYTETKTTASKVHGTGWIGEEKRKEKEKRRERD